MEQETRNNTEKNAAEKKGMSARELNFCITLIGSLLGMAIPQNNKYKNGNEPLPDDIRANKKEGKEYSTIGDVLKNGGSAKVALIGVAIIIGIALICYIAALLYYGAASLQEAL